MTCSSKIICLPTKDFTDLRRPTQNPPTILTMKQFLLLLTFSLTVSIQAQSFYDLETIQTIEITFAESNWDQLLDQAYASTSDYILAQSVTINGEVFDSVGVKYKGNSTYNANQTKNPFHIELDTYKDHIYDGYTDIKLSNVAKDPSFIREVLSYQVLRQYMDAPLSNYANVYVNGNLMGLYSNSEAISRKFVDKYYGSKENARIKCNPPAGAGQGTTVVPDLQYRGEDSSAYYAAYELKSDFGWSELIDLCDTLNNHVNDIEQILDVDRVLWMLAFDNVLVNLDSYIGTYAQNYYLYRDDNGRFLPTVWDLNESLGVFSDAGGGIRLNSTAQKAQLSHLLHENDASFPLISKLLSVPQYKRKYLAHVKTMLEENFANGAYEDMALMLRTTIDAAVQADNNKFFTYNNFVSNLTADIADRRNSTPGITNLMDARSDYLLGLSDFTQAEPAISNVALSGSSPAVGEALTITATITDALRAYLNLRSVSGAPFETIEMFDDGAHGDGAAGDGVFGVSFVPASIQTEYYLYAENDGIGKFSPQRAEHEFYELVASNTSSLIGDLVINEFMASNDLTQADQDGDFDDWIELYNNTGASISLDGFYLSDDAGNLTKWAFPDGSTIAANDYLIIWADEDLEQDGLHADFKLSSGGEEVVLIDANGAIVDSLTYPEQTTDVSYGRFPNGTGSFREMTTTTFNAENTDGTTNPDDPTFSTSPLAGDLVVNEFMASNDTTAVDQDGDADDWIELYNNSSSSISLDGFFLSDDIEEPTKWAFPAGSSIDGNGYLIIWADEDLEQDGLHADFKLSAGGEMVLLFDADTSLIDTVTYVDQSTDISHGRFPNGTGSFQDMTPTFNAENTEGTTDPVDPTFSTSPLAGELVINEFMASNDATQADQDGDFDDWIELYNNSSSSITLDGFFLSDDIDNPTKWAFPAGTSIAANGYLIIWADEDLDQEGLHADFKLSAGGEMVVLFDADTALIDTITYVDQVADISHGRFANGTGGFLDMTPTFNAENVNGIVSTRFIPLLGAEITLFPNPSEGLLNVRLEQAYSDDLQFRLFSSDGRLLQESTLSQGAVNLTINATNLPEGLYLLTVLDGLATETHKVVLRR